MIPPEPPPLALADRGAAPSGDERQARLFQAQKLEAIGQLTGGIAHDFNNLLAIVIGSTEALSQALEADRELGPVARMALDAAERGAELVARLLTFARSQPTALEPVDCGGFLDEMALVLRRVLGEAVRVRVQVTDAPLHCLADRTQLTSAILNLAVNARDAMPNGGVLTLAAERRSGPNGRDEALITVSDTGEGMTAETLARASEPFFTTKPVGEGTGLGLSMVSGFARQSGGRLEIGSAPGRGCAARLFLPCGETAGIAVQPTAALAAD
ncbi:sensor histidine kinase [Phenylobacterium sp.]|jgi:signal transduction histidine kinase|uniref:sensor histidine kinase n=1 Tax=Phenylobacterium sp. TaxID=1871053 RepID=UPI002F4032D5